MSIGDTLKKLLMEEDDSEGQPPKPPEEGLPTPDPMEAARLQGMKMMQQPDQSAGTQAAPPPPVKPAAPVVNSGRFNQEMYEKLKSALDRSRGKGPCFMSFMDSVNAMTAVDIDEVTAFKGSAATAKMKKETLIASANDYLKTLEAEKAKFSQELDSKIGKDILLLETGIKSDETQMAELTAKLEALSSQKIAKEKQRADLTAKKSDIASQFEASSARVASELDTNIKKITAYL